MCMPFCYSCLKYAYAVNISFIVLCLIILVTSGICGTSKVPRHRKPYWATYETPEVKTLECSRSSFVDEGETGVFHTPRLT